MSKNNQHILKYFNENLRFDGRGLLGLRELRFNLGVSGTAEGSAEVFLGETHVIAGVKMSIGTPYSDSPDEGVLMVNAELSPIASPDFEAGPPSRESIELARIVDRGLREAPALDVKKLCIKEKEYVWIVAVDINIVNDDGNLIDASGIAAILALMDTKLPAHNDEGLVDYYHKTEERLPIMNIPIPTTVYKIGDYKILDPTSSEEPFVDYRMTITSYEPNTICAMQKGGAKEMESKELLEIVDLCIDNSNKVREFIKGKVNLK
ncbi:MAG: exosome complex protein Rrp42 [Nitrospiraceae bacterium]|nr:exosome complex protein Rrp42 [Nitrospiraceae bacterium]